MKWPLRFPYKAVNLTQNFRLKGSPPPIIFARIISPTNALQLCRWQFLYRCYGWGATSENRSKIGQFALTLWSKISGTRGRSPPIIFVQLVTPMNALQLCPRQFSHSYYGWGATSDYWLKIGDFVPMGVGWPKISPRRGRPPTNHSSSQKN